MQLPSTIKYGGTRYILAKYAPSFYLSKEALALLNQMLGKKNTILGICVSGLKLYRNKAQSILKKAREKAATKEFALEIDACLAKLQKRPESKRVPLNLLKDRPKSFKGPRKINLRGPKSAVKVYTGTVTFTQKGGAKPIGSKLDQAAFNKWAKQKLTSIHEQTHAQTNTWFAFDHYSKEKKRSDGPVTTALREAFPEFDEYVERYKVYHPSQIDSGDYVDIAKEFLSDLNAVLTFMNLRAEAKKEEQANAMYKALMFRLNTDRGYWTTLMKLHKRGVTWDVVKSVVRSAPKKAA